MSNRDKALEDIRLTIELVPSTCWFNNIRTCVSKADWDKIRKSVYKNSHYFCEICAGQGQKHPVECHEVWHYDDKVHIQKLERMIALCPSCHEVKHIGLAKVKGRLQYAMNHLAKVNDWNLIQVTRYVSQSFKTWERRSQFQWDVNLSQLSLYNVVIKDMP
jgi:hypothetical protein